MKTENEPVGLFDFVRNFFRVLGAVNSVIKETDESFRRLTIRKDIFDVANQVIPPALNAAFVQKLIEWSRDNPAIIPKALAVMVIVGTSWNLISSAFADYYFWLHDAFLKNIRSRIDEILGAKADSLDIACVSDQKISEMRQNAEQVSSAAVLSIWDERRNLFDGLLTAFMAFVALFLSDRIVAILILLPIATDFFRYWFNKRVVDKWRKEVKDNEKLSREYKKCLTDKKMMIQVRLFGIVDYLKHQYLGLREEYHRTRRAMLLSQIIIGWVILLIRTIVSTVGIFILIWQITQGSISLGSLLMFMGQVGALSSAGGRVARAVKNIVEETEDFEAYEEYLKVVPFIDETSATPHMFKTPPRITVDNVTFGYDTTRPPVLRGCSLVVEPGEKIAVVGTNGSGKTTLANVIAKMYLSKEGHVLADGVSLATITQKSWLNQLLYVTWGTEVPDFPIEEVVAGVRKEEIDIDRLLTAAKITGVHDFVKSLPWQYGTQVGTKLSTGQLQRIRLACGIYRLLSDSVHVAIFDEPMANCDHAIRASFYGAIRGFSKKIVIVIAHDPMYLNHFDRVVVMKEGSVVDDIHGAEAINAYKMKLLES